jgi:hypothetical protein
MTMGNETTVGGDMANWTIDTELEFPEFKEMIERMFNIKKNTRKNKSMSRTATSGGNKKSNGTTVIDETSQSMINSTIMK